MRTVPMNMQKWYSIDTYTTTSYHPSTCNYEEDDTEQSRPPIYTLHVSGETTNYITQR
jgi:hypothetical protein